MRTVSEETKQAWLSGDYTGANRPMMRATIQKFHGFEVPQPSGDDRYYCGIFGQTHVPRELPNIKSVRWNRSVDIDVATCEIVLYNTAPLPLGVSPERDEELDLPGYYTYNRGATSWSTSRWGHTTNAWQNWLVPDRLIRTYEGYGYDRTEIPENDPHMYLSGVWLIDDVEYTHDGLITVTCRDVGRLLLDQMMFPRVVPFKQYPLSFTRFYTVDNPDITVITGSTKWVHPNYSTDSGVPYFGYNGTAYGGHNGSDAFDGSVSSPNNDSYWVSVGNDSPHAPYSYEFVEGKIKAGTVSAVKFHVWGGPYRAYISLAQNGSWLGKHSVPYDPNNPVSSPNGADVSYLKAVTVDKNDTFTWRPDKPYANITKVRVCFTDLYDSGVGVYPYRAGLRDFQVAIGTTTSKTIDGGYHWAGNYGDYTDIVKLLCAYGGFYWPNDSQRAFITNTDGSTTTYMPSPGNDVQTYATGGYTHTYRPVETGRVWGDFELTKTNGPATLTVDIFDKKPLMDGINYIRDIVGFLFYIDETGGVNFRSPNIWQVGNRYGDLDPNAGSTTDMVTIDERQTLIGLRAKLSSRNIRERVVVANVNGKIGASYPAQGKPSLNPFPSGMRRVAGWTDQNFATNDECQIMADLIALREFFTYRTDVLTIAGNPAIQIDDQVQIYERVTNEGFVHYVTSIESRWDLEDGKWTYDIETHWLQDENGAWAFEAAQMSPQTVQYLQAIGKI